jgi:hypothetical protein
LALAFTPDGRALVVGGNDGLIRFWDLASGEETATRAGHAGPVTFLACSTDGKRLTSAGAVWVASVGARTSGLDGDSSALTWDLTELRKTVRFVPPKLAAADVEAVWSDLSGVDAGKAYDALWRLAAASELAVPLLKERLPQTNPVETAAPNVDKLLADLDDVKFSVREIAMQELIRLGPPVVPAVRLALATTTSREVKRRAEEVLATLKAVANMPTELLRAARGVEVLEHINTAETKELLKSWAAGPAAAPLTQHARSNLARGQ